MTVSGIKIFLCFVPVVFDRCNFKTNVGSLKVAVITNGSAAITHVFKELTPLSTHRNVDNLILRDMIG